MWFVIHCRERICTSVRSQVDAGEVPVPPEFCEVGSLLSLLIVDLLVVFVDETPTFPEIQEAFCRTTHVFTLEFNTLLISVIWLVVPFHVRDNVPQESGGYVGESLHRLFSTFGDVNSAHFSRDFVYTIFVNSSYW